jgi:PAS domain S-box-containing protein
MPFSWLPVFTKMTSETHGARRSSEPLDFRALIETIPALVICTLADGSAEFANRAWHEYTGRSSPERTDWSWQTAIHTDDLPRLIREWTVTATSMFEMEARVQRADGEYQWFAMRKALAVSRDQVGKPSLRAFIACEDIHERKQAQVRLEQNEQRWRTAFENSAIGITMRDQEGRFIAANSVFQDMLGYTKSELCQLNFMDVTYEEDRKADLELSGEILEGKRQHYQIEKRYRRKDGALLWVRNNVALVPGTRDVAPFLIAVVEDITQRKQEESARRYSEERYRVVVETANDAVVSADESGAIQFANPAIMRVFGYDPAELIGKPLTALMPEFMRKLHENGFRRYLTTGQRHVNWQGNEFTGLRKNGQEFPVEVSFGELTMNGHRVFTGFIRDISERKQAEEEREKLVRAQADLAHINRVSTMGELTASLGHEIKQPISAAMTDAQTCMRWLACERPEVAEAREAASRVVKDVTRANEIIGRIGSLFKKHVPMRELIDVNELIREMIGLMRSEASRYSISIRSELADGLPQIMADRVGLQQVLMNLMLNGVEAMRDMPAPGTLTIVSRRSDDGQLTVSILDTGVGVSSEQVDKIFSAFVTSKALGTGMGLPISRSIIESHGGRLWATPNTGPGATFQFVLPIEPSAQQTA